MREAVTVVSGLPRSGTSLMMGILEAAGLPILSDGRRKPDPSNPRGYFELEAVKGTRRDADWLQAAPGCAVKVIASLLGELPRDYAYRVILMRRPIEAVIASQNSMLARLGEPVPPIDDVRLGEILRTQLEASRRLLDEDACFEWIEVDYTALVRHPGPILENLGEFLGRAVDPEALAERIDPDLDHHETPGDRGAHERNDDPKADPGEMASPRIRTAS